MSSKGTSFVGAELAHYEECMRSIPAILLARLAGRERDALMLFETLKISGLEKGIEAGTAWGIYSSAAMVWLQRAFVAHADAAGVSVDELLRDAIAAAAEWVEL